MRFSAHFYFAGEGQFMAQNPTLKVDGVSNLRDGINIYQLNLMEVGKSIEMKQGLGNS